MSLKSVAAAVVPPVDDSSEDGDRVASLAVESWTAVKDAAEKWSAADDSRLAALDVYRRAWAAMSEAKLRRQHLADAGVPDPKFLDT